MKLSEVIKRTYKSLTEDANYYSNKNLFIVGKNTAGKSKMIRELIKKSLHDRNNILYFIDSKNRKVKTIERQWGVAFSDISIETILASRIDKKYFNKEDIFDSASRTEAVWEELLKGEEKYPALFEEVLDMKLEYTDTGLDENREISVNGVELMNLSDAQNAMIRILMEVNYAYEKRCRTVIIDEFDIHLDSDNCYLFINKLMEKYPTLHFILAVHSPYTILGVRNFDILQIKLEYEDVDDNECLYYESNDMDDINIIHKKLFHSRGEENRLDTILSNALSQAVRNGNLENDLYKEIEREIPNFTIRQKVVYEYILQKLGGQNEDRISNKI